MPGYMVVPAAPGDGPTSEARHYRCPVAGAMQPWVDEVLFWWRMIKAGAARLVDLVPVPSAGAWQALDVVDQTLAEVRRVEAERREASRGHR